MGKGFRDGLCCGPRFPKEEMPKKKISKEKINKIIEDLKARLGCHLSNLGVVDDEIKEVLEEHFEITES